MINLANKLLVFLYYLSSLEMLKESSLYPEK